MNFWMRSLAEYREAYQKSVAAPDLFWAEIAAHFAWRKPWAKVCEWNFDDYCVNWFLGSKLNITENIIERAAAEFPDRTAIVFEPNDPQGEVQRITYRELAARVNRLANGLKSLGVKKGDCVTLYMPMVPEAVVAMLACARLGAVHSVVFGGFSAVSLAERIKDAKSSLVVTADGNRRGDKLLPLKGVVDEALSMAGDTVKNVVVLRNLGGSFPVSLNQHPQRREVWWHELVETQSPECDAIEVDAEDPLFILYTSGSTGKPKGVVHSSGGYMVYTAYTFQNVFQYRPDEIYFCTADVGWITGHSYVTYGPLLCGATVLMYEGIPTYPDAGRLWEICEKHQVNILYTAPTAIRSLMALGDQHAEKHELKSLRVLGTVGEPINQEAWEWYFEKVGKKRCPIVDTWWQTETGGIMISGLGDLTPAKPCYATLPLPGIQPCIVDASGKEVTAPDVEGMLCVRYPWPSMLRTTFGDHERCQRTYFSAYPGMYFTGDAARKDADGNYRIIGRVDDVINVSGHRLGTAEIENAINDDEYVIESAVVGYPHAIKGQGILAFVVCGGRQHSAIQLNEKVRENVTRKIGPIAKPDLIVPVSGLPKTRSGKIMRRILRKIGEGDFKNLGDISTLLNPEVVDETVRSFQQIQQTPSSGK